MYTNSERIVPVERDEHGRRKYLGRAASDLGVSRQHLYMVLSGRRSSASLMERVQEMHPELLTV